jgi:pantoate--beta-alanine ligase
MPDSTGLEIVQKAAELRMRLEAWRKHGARIALVPTMGALHAGHMSLVAKAREQADKIVMSIFVNPTQFAPSEDFASYPRTLEADAEKFADAGGDLVFAPQPAEIYPVGFATMIEPAGPAKMGLEDAFRPSHFAGVATIVAKLFNLSRPDFAIFGEKDYQQLKVVTRLVRDLDFDIEIIAAPTLREKDGLALSSRNAYLSAQERSCAPKLQAELVRCADAIRNGSSIATAVKEAQDEMAAAGFVTDYLTARHAETLAPVEGLGAGPIRLLAAARLGRTRLIDNIEV